MADIHLGLDVHSELRQLPEPQITEEIFHSTDFRLVRATNPGWENTPKAANFLLIPNPLSADFQLAQNALTDFAKNIGFNRTKSLTLNDSDEQPITGLVFDDSREELNQQLLHGQETKTSTQYGYKIPALAQLEQTVLDQLKDVPQATQATLIALGRRLSDQETPSIINDGRLLLRVSRWLKTAGKLGKLDAIDQKHLPHYLSAVINAGDLAVQVAKFTPEQAAQYRQDTLISIGSQYADYCADSKYNPETAERLVKSFREAAGDKPANEALVTAFTLKRLKHQNRQTIIDGLADNNQAILTVFAEEENFLRFGILNDEPATRRTVTNAFYAEVKRRGIGTDAEQMTNLFWQMIENDSLLISEYVVGLLLSTPFWALAYKTAESLIENPQAFKDNPIVGSAAIGFVLVTSIMFPGILEFSRGEERKQFFSKISQFAKIHSTYRKTGQAPGTPRLEGSEPSI